MSGCKPRLALVVIMGEKSVLMPALSNGGFMQGFAKQKHGAKQLFIVKPESGRCVGCHVGFDIVGPPGLHQTRFAKFSYLPGAVMIG